MNTSSIIQQTPPDITLGPATLEGWDAKTSLKQEVEGLYIYRLRLVAETAGILPELTLKWRLPAVGIKGVWKSNSLHNKRFQYDWELEHLQSRASTDAPVVCVFDQQDLNLVTFAASEVVELVEMNALLREEDNHLYCHVTLCRETTDPVTEYEITLRIDARQIAFYTTIQAVSQWWAAMPASTPVPVPDLARVPLYSTWYNYHQELVADELIAEARLAVDLGYELMIIDDGWQTNDNNRGYDFTGDWEPERLTEMRQLVDDLHAVGMKVALWYSVPFCGKKSKAYQHFRGKFLTEDHRWAPVFDPRYPEVRAYLINKYAKALKDWDLDGFKLDFIDDFKLYPDTPVGKANGRDYHSVNAAVDRLLVDIYATLSAIKSDVVIEFRQQYIGPAVRKCGNMLRAFDCPNDALTNRIRTTDVKLLCGKTAVHSDMITWHPDEPVEVAALQLTNIIFSVPQLSIILADTPAAYLEMIRFYTQYWREHKEILLDGHFVAHDPLGNYPMLQAQRGNHAIIGVYAPQVVQLPVGASRIDVFNGKPATAIYLSAEEPQRFELATHNCQGQLEAVTELVIVPGVTTWQVPVAGLLKLTKIHTSQTK